jgi:hypothetical protein
MNLTQLVRTMHNICKFRGSNPNHHKKRQLKMIIFFIERNNYLLQNNVFNIKCTSFKISLLFVKRIDKFTIFNFLTYANLHMSMG